MLAKYDALNPVALRSLIAGGAKLKAFPADVIDAAYVAAHEVYDEISARERRLQDNLRQRQGVPQRGLPVVASGGIHLRHLHDPQPHEGLVDRTRQRQPSGDLVAWPKKEIYINKLQV